MILVPLATTCALFGGIHGVAIAQSITVAIASIFYFFPLMRVLEIDVKKLLDALFPSMLPSGCILLSLWFIDVIFRQHPILQASVFLKLLTSIFVTALILIVFVSVYSRELILRIKDKSLFNSLNAESGQSQSEPQREVQAKSQQEPQVKHSESHYDLHPGESKVNTGFEASQKAS
jgi:hypothetical protein